MKSLPIRYYHFNNLSKVIILLQLLLSLSLFATQKTHTGKNHYVQILVAAAQEDADKDEEGAVSRQKEQEQQHEEVDSGGYRMKDIISETASTTNTNLEDEGRRIIDFIDSLKDVKNDDKDETSGSSTASSSLSTATETTSTAATHDDEFRTASSKVAELTDADDDDDDFEDDFDDDDDDDDDDDLDNVVVEDFSQNMNSERKDEQKMKNEDKINAEEIPSSKDGTRSKSKAKENEDTTKETKYPGDHAILFPPNDEYDNTDFRYFNENYDQEKNNGLRSGTGIPIVHSASPYGGYSRAARSRLAKLPLRFYNGDDETQEKDEKDDVNEKTTNDNGDNDMEFYLNVRDGMGRLYTCKWYHESELTPQAISRSVFDYAPLVDEEGADTYYYDWGKSPIDVLSESTAIANTKNSASKMAGKLGSTLKHLLKGLDSSNVNIDENDDNVEVFTFNLDELMAEEGFDGDDLNMDNPDHADAIARAIQRHLNRGRGGIAAGNGDVVDVAVIDGGVGNAQNIDLAGLMARAAAAAAGAAGVGNAVAGAGNAVAGAGNAGAGEGGAAARVGNAAAVDGAAGDANNNFVMAAANAAARAIGAANIGGNNGIHPVVNGGGSGGGGDNKSLTKKMSSASSNKSNDLSKKEILKSLKKNLRGLCSQVHKGWWSYEWCFESDISQFHLELVTEATKTASAEDRAKSSSANSATKNSNQDAQYKIASVLRLGTYNPTVPELISVEVPKVGKHIGQSIIRAQQTYDQGEYCEELGRERVVKTIYRCCGKFVDDSSSTSTLKSDSKSVAILQDVAEEETCVYTALVCTKFLCDDEYLDANVVGNNNSEKGNAENDDGSSIAKKQDESQAKEVVTDSGSDEYEYEYLGSVTSTVEDTTNTENDKSKISKKSKTNNNDINVPPPENKLEEPLHINKKPPQDESIRQILDRTLGKVCLQKDAGWWKYEFCHSRLAREFHVEVSLDPKTGKSIVSVEDENKLGLFDVTSGLYPKSEEHLHVLDLDVWDSNNKENKNKQQGSSTFYKSNANGGITPAFIQEYPNGDICTHPDVIDAAVKGGTLTTEGSGVQRSTTARFTCGPKFELVNVEEDSTCHYLFDITVPDLCNHPLFRPAVLESRVLKCLPVESEFS